MKGGILGRLAAVVMLSLAGRSLFPVRLDAQSESIRKPALKVEQPVFDFGLVVQGTKVVHDFVVKNAGSGDLVIQRVVPSCGCTAASSSTTPIASGQSGTVHVEFDTNGFSGEKLKTVRLYTNDQDNPTPVLSLKGTIETDILVEPRRISFEEVTRGADPLSIQQDLVLRIRKGSGVKINSVKSLSKYVTLKEDSASDLERKFKVSLDASAPAGELRERIVVSLSGGKTSSLNVPIYAQIRGKLQLDPATVSFGIIEGTSLLSRSVKIENVGNQKIAVTDIKPSDVAITAKLKTLNPGKSYELEVALDPKKVTRDLKATIELATDSSEEGGLSLNVYGILPPKS